MNHSITYQGNQVNVTSEGSGEILLFLHGWPTNSRLWKYQVDYFKNRYQVITLDWLGFGKSSKPLDYHYTFSQKQAVLGQVVGELDARINLVAHDVGGPPAILWSYENQERVKRLILLNTVIYPFSTPLDKSSHFFFRVPLLKKVLVSDAAITNLILSLGSDKSPQTRQHVAEIMQWHQRSSTKVRLKTILEPIGEGKRNEIIILAEKFRELKVSKQLIIARKDPLCYAHINKLSTMNPEVPVHRLEDCGHFIPIDQPEKLNEVLDKILSE